MLFVPILAVIGIIEGFVPIIINITPVTDFMGLLGLGEKEKLEVGS